MADTQTTDVGYLDSMQDNGFENMKSQDIATPMLLIAQAMSDVVSSGSVKIGHFYNSLTGEDYGNSVELIVCHFDKMWVEWKPNQGGFVGRHPIGSIPVTGDIYTGMKHGDNDVIETWTYLVIPCEHPEAGYMAFSSTPGNVKYLKAWNTQMKYLRTPSGKPAPLFSARWRLTTNKVTSKAGKDYFACAGTDGKASAKFVGWVNKETYDNNVAPARQIATQALALAAPVAETESAF